MPSIIWRRRESAEEVVIRSSGFLPALGIGIALIVLAFAVLPNSLYGYMLGLGWSALLAWDTWRVQAEIVQAQAFQALSASGSLLSLRNPLTYRIKKG